MRPIIFIDVLDRNSKLRNINKKRYIEKVMICAPCLSIEQFMKKRRNCKVFDNLLNRLSQSCPNISFTQLKKHSWIDTIGDKKFVYHTNCSEKGWKLASSYLNDGMALIKCLAIIPIKKIKITNSRKTIYFKVIKKNVILPNFDLAPFCTNLSEFQIIYIKIRKDKRIEYSSSTNSEELLFSINREELSKP
ncbi:hypothetical protein BpHYR1_011521 [Brachionus plicatilis]|uniref:Uncharacterized protein n=1 Tax=Brachionus plicatilis TaxID=10195 RepID=A0A3M7R026_BRAPC|nr:hypothetical protein BpHYR1_011521 [Brachionus plicatilis]